MTTHVDKSEEAAHNDRLDGMKDAAEVSFEIPPFGIAPDSRMIFVHPHFEEVRKGLLNTILLDSGFGVVTGEVGSGKTTLLHRIIADLPPDFEVAMIMNTCLKPDELLLAIADDLGIPTKPEPGRPELDRRQLLAAIGARLDANFAAGRKTIIIIDEAQHLSDETLELARMLSNLKSEGGKGVRFLLFGQEQLRERLLRPELQAFVSRIGAQFHLNPLSFEETEEYVRHRLVASRPTMPVTLSDKAVVSLRRASSGLPRRINIVAGNALQICLKNHRREITTRDIVKAAKAVAMPVDRRARERHYTAAAGWILFFALSVFAGRQYFRNIGLVPSVGLISPLATASSPAVALIPPQAVAELAPIASESIPVPAALIPPAAAMLPPASASIPPLAASASAPIASPPVAAPIAPQSVAIAQNPNSQIAPQSGVTAQNSRSLEGNMRGSDVTRLQMRLAELGYFKHAPTDKFGGATSAAVMAFQKDRGIREQGTAGPLTFAALYGPNEQAKPSEVRRIPTVAVPAVRSIPTATIVARVDSQIQNPKSKIQNPTSLGGNARGSEVTRLQKRLAELGYFKEPPTDKFGRATLAAMLAFQKDRGIPEHGVAGPRTLAALYGTNEQAKPSEVPAAAASISPPATSGSALTASQPVDVPIQNPEEKPADAR